MINKTNKIINIHTAGECHHLSSVYIDDDDLSPSDSSSGSVSFHSSEWYPESLRIFTRSPSGYLRMCLSLFSIREFVACVLFF